MRAAGIESREESRNDRSLSYPRSRITLTVDSQRETQADTDEHRVQESQ